MITKLKTKNREEWKALRHRYIGGSDAAAVVGMNAYKSPYTLWAEKTNRLPEFDGNLATDVGTYLEDFVAHKFEELTGKKVRKDNQSWVNDKYPWAIANIDRCIVGEDAILECKTTSEMNLKNFRGGEYPSNYYVQVVHYLAVTGKKKAYIAVLIGNKDFKIFEVDRDEEEIKVLMQAEEEFYDLIQKDIAPTIDGSKSTTETIKAFYPQSAEDETVDLFSMTSVLDRLFDLKAQIKALEAIHDENENLIKDYMKTAGKGESEAYSVSWKTSERNTFDSKAFALANPDIDLKPYYKISTTRTFRANKRKVGK